MLERIKKLPVNRWVDIALFIFLLIFPLIFNDYRTGFMGKTAAYMIFALSLDLLWGYTGLMSFGHAALFGLGGYIVGLSFSIQDGIPAFMSRMGVEELPWFLKILENNIVASLLGLIIPAAFAAFLGYFIFSSKVSGIFFSLITMALAQIFETFFANQSAYTNGTSGLGGLPRSFFGIELKIKPFYYLTIGIVILVYLLCLWLTNSRFGKVLMSVREDERRLSFIGYNPARFKIAVYALSGMLAGLSGMLFVPFNGMISPTELGISLSTMVLIWIAVGGRGNLTGAMLGTVLINWLQPLLSEYSADIWPLVLGALILAVIFLIPTGIIGKLKEIQYNISARRTLEKLSAKEEENHG